MKNKRHCEKCKIDWVADVDHPTICPICNPETFDHEKVDPPVGYFVDTDMYIYKGGRMELKRFLRNLWSKPKEHSKKYFRVEPLTEKLFKCKKCKNDWIVTLIPLIANQCCPECGADAYGVVYPKKRIEPRNIVEGSTSNIADEEKEKINNYLIDNQSFLDYKSGKKEALGRLIGDIKKLITTLNPKDIKIYLESLL